MRHAVLKVVLLVVSLTATGFVAGTDDGLITSKTKLKLWSTGKLRSNAVHVETRDGVVTLTGKASSPAQKTLAERAVREIVGVRGVTNRLQVVAEPVAQPGDRSGESVQVGMAGP